MNRPKSWAIIKIGWLVAVLLLVVGTQATAQKNEAPKTEALDAGEAATPDTPPDAPKETKKKKAANKAAAQAENAAKPGAAAEPTAPDGATAPAENTVEQGTYTVRLRDLEERVNRLKEQIFRSKARLSLLAETVLEKKIAGAQASISFRNEMGGSFRLYKASLLLDGGPIYTATDEAGSLSKRQKIDLFEGPVMPGDHTLEVVLQYKGHGYGIFSYLKGYTFKIRSSYTFTVNEGKAIQLEVIGFEKGGATTPLEERPAVRYVEEFGEYDIMSSAVPAEKSEE
ncbi:MAG: hypothetical protein JXX29_18055 [Deltaproteobacteria bacterium]|nr:hypothetical protein [Deltaproteobacteria bacterium]MBN2673591.1 hypothetical protein [Deltaproteobacteria bacterium]